MPRRDAERGTVAVMGASESGKTSFLRSELARLKPSRLMVWDALDKGDYADVPRAATLAELCAIVKAPAFKVRYVPPKATSEKWWERFGVFCGTAYETGELVMVAEELQLVTAANGGPEDWSNCTLRGMHHCNLTIYGTAQRPAQVDKDFFGNATFAWCGRLNYADDVTTMARLLRVDADAVGELRQLEYLTRDMRTGERSRGAIVFKKNRPTLTAKPL